MAYRSVRCARCRVKVLPWGGGWLAADGSPFCGADPRFPHVCAPGTSARGVDFHYLWFVPVTAGLVFLVVVLAVSTPSIGTGEQARAQPTIVLPRAESGGPVAPPGAPVPCDEEFTQGPKCFPVDVVTGKQVMRRLAADRGWVCYRKGQRDDSDFDILDAGECQSDGDGRLPVQASADISYLTDNNEINGTMTELNITASTGAQLWRGERVSVVDTERLSPKVMDIAGQALWPGHPEWRDQLRTAFAQAQTRCGLNGPGNVENPVRTPLGYDVSCTGITSVSVSGAKGTAQTFTETISVRAPLH